MHYATTCLAMAMVSLGMVEAASIPPYLEGTHLGDGKYSALHHKPVLRTNQLFHIRLALERVESRTQTQI